MDLQSLAVDAIVAACAAYVVWVLLPAAARRRAALAALRLPLHGRLAASLGAIAARRGSCGCDDCPSSAPATPAKTIRIVRRG
jgi:hypothetical protein